MNPKNRHNTDFKYCFYGHEFKKGTIDDQGVHDVLNSFLNSKAMEFCPLVESGKWLWPGLIKGMRRSAFCFFESNTNNRNVHIEIGYALAMNCSVILAIKEENLVQGLPSNLSGIIQLRYRDLEDLKQKLELDIPNEYYSVEARLRKVLSQITEIEKVYLSLLIDEGEFRFSDLSGSASRRSLAHSSNPVLAAFMRKFDEALIITKGSNLDRFQIQIDPDYLEFIKCFIGHKN